MASAPSSSAKTRRSTSTTSEGVYRYSVFSPRSAARCTFYHPDASYPSLFRYLLVLSRPSVYQSYLFQPYIESSRYLFVCHEGERDHPIFSKLDPTLSGCFAGTVLIGCTPRRSVRGLTRFLKEFVNSRGRCPGCVRTTGDLSPSVWRASQGGRCRCIGCSPFMHNVPEGSNMYYVRAAEQPVLAAPHTYRCVQRPGI